jgi:hypothetical protein
MNDADWFTLSISVFTDVAVSALFTVREKLAVAVAPLASATVTV